MKRKIFDVVFILIIVVVFAFVYLGQKSTIDDQEQRSDALKNDLQAKLRDIAIMDSLKVAREEHFDSLIVLKDAELYVERKKIQKYEKALVDVGRISMSDVADSIAEYYSTRRSSEYRHLPP